MSETVIWDAKGNAHCGTCDAVKEVKGDIQALRAARWHHSKGTTLGGQDYESILCPLCAKGERKRPHIRPVQFDGQLELFGGEHDTAARHKGSKARRDNAS